LKIQLYMAVNLRREAERGEKLGGVHRHERLLDAMRAGDPEVVIEALATHGATAYLA
jgi:DNA-binding GntR family transcriptional regulator